MQYQFKTHGPVCPHCIKEFKDNNQSQYPLKPHFFASLTTLRSHMSRFHKGAEKVKTKDITELSKKVHTHLYPVKTEKVIMNESETGIKLYKERDCACCLDRVCCGVLVPCGHTNVCSDCYKQIPFQWIKDNDGNDVKIRKCPTCRAPVVVYWGKAVVYPNMS